MIAIDDDKTTLRITRGDNTDTYHKIAVTYPVWDFSQQKEVLYEFQLNDKITFSAYEKNGYRKPPVFTKSFTLSQIGYTEPTEAVEIPLTATETKEFELLDKPKTYWYDIVLNDTTTILGYDEDGAKLLIVYPEAEEWLYER